MSETPRTDEKRKVAIALGWNIECVWEWAMQLESELIRLGFPDGPDGAATMGSEREALIAQVGRCCEGADPYCVSGCLVQAALRRRAEK